MASYLVLTPPGGPGKANQSTRFIRDGFSVLAFVFPVFWLAFNRLWLPAALALVLQIVAGQLTQMPGLLLAGLALGASVNLLTALEGRNLLANTLQLKGWKLDGVVSADSLDMAEEIHFLNRATPTAAEQLPVVDWGRTETAAQPAATGGNASAPGLLLSDGGRR